jgi:hypothetical protein
VLDIFKKPHEEQPEEQKPAEPEPQMQPEISESPQEETIPVEPEAEPVVQPEPEPEPEPLELPKVEESLPITLESLKQEELSLLNQKTELLTIEEQLRLKTVEEIEMTKQRIASLKLEIPELKQKCEGLAKALEIPVYNTPAD